MHSQTQNCRYLGFGTSCLIPGLHNLGFKGQCHINVYGQRHTDQLFAVDSLLVQSSSRTSELIITTTTIKQTWKTVTSDQWRVSKFLRLHVHFLSSISLHVQMCWSSMCRQNLPPNKCIPSTLHRITRNTHRKSANCAKMPCRYNIQYIGLCNCMTRREECACARNNSTSWQRPVFCQFSPQYVEQLKIGLSKV